MRIVNDVSGTPIKPAEVEIGQLINAEPAVFFEADEEGEPLYEGVHLQQEKAKAAIIVVRMRPEDITPSKGRENWGYDGILCYSKICTHVGLPDLAVGAADAPPAVPLPPVDLRPRRQRRRRVRPGGPGPPPATSYAGRRGLPRGAERLH